MLMHQAGRLDHDANCRSLELFATEVMPEFVEDEAEREAAKAERLAPAIEAALARKRAWPCPRRSRSSSLRSLQPLPDGRGLRGRAGTSAATLGALGVRAVGRDEALGTRRAEHGAQAERDRHRRAWSRGARRGGSGSAPSARAIPTRRGPRRIAGVAGEVVRRRRSGAEPSASSATPRPSGVSSAPTRIATSVAGRTRAAAATGAGRNIDGRPTRSTGCRARSGRTSPGARTACRHRTARRRSARRTSRSVRRDGGGDPRLQLVGDEGEERPAPPLGYGTPSLPASRPGDRRRQVARAHGLGGAEPLDGVADADDAAGSAGGGPAAGSGRCRRSCRTPRWRR